jgi:hypothetical protein
MNLPAVGKRLYNIRTRGGQPMNYAVGRDDGRMHALHDLAIAHVNSVPFQIHLWNSGIRGGSR